MEWTGVEHIIFLQLPAPCLANAEAEVVKVEDTVRVRVDADEHSFLLGQLAVGVEQMHAFWMRVEFGKTPAHERDE